ncbi:MAG: M56 family metallopeptidase [Pseudomonadota bacterium]
MSAMLLSLYLKLNVLLVVAWVLWWLIKRTAVWLGFEASQSQQLNLARFLFLASLLLLPLTAVLDVVLPLWKTGIAGIMAGREIIVTAAMEQALPQDGLGALSLEFLFLTVLLTVVLLQGHRVWRQLSQLRQIVSNATPWKKIHGIELLVSSAITTPFSTRALGGKQIVLPSDLLTSPRNLQLAVKHELQHVRNHDLEWVILLEAVKALCSWNPAVWLWHNEFDCLQEFACDEVLVNERQVSREGYGNCLLEVASNASGSALLAASNMVPKFSFWQDNQYQLKRRILMLMKTGRKYSTLKSICYGLLIGSGLLVEAGVVAGAEQGEQLQPNLLPLVRISPKYPPEALAEKREAWVQLQFSIDETGAVYEPKVIDHCVRLQIEPANVCEQSDLFDAASVAALSKWKYAAEERRDVQTILRYQLSE